METPVSADENSIYTEMNPMQCRLRDQTYAAPIKVDVEYVKGKHVVTRTGRQSVEIGRLPLMLRSDRCGAAVRKAALTVLAGSAGACAGVYCKARRTRS